MTRLVRAELGIDAQVGLGECPMWDESWSALLFLDIEEQKLCMWRPGSGRMEALPIAARVTAFALTSTSLYLVAADRGFSWFDPAIGRMDLIAPLVDVAIAAMNDGKVDPHGRFWAGSASVDRARRDGGLWMLDSDLVVRQMLGGIGMSNGLAWSPEGDTLFHVDTLEGTVSAYDVIEGSESSALGNGLVIGRISESEGLLDGMAVDETGALWVAVWGAGEVRRYTSHGVIDTVVEVDASQPTSCCFGGSGDTTLFITTARQGLREPKALDGGVFAVDVGVRGVAPPRFSGPISSGARR